MFQFYWPLMALLLPLPLLVRYFTATGSSKTGRQSPEIWFPATGRLRSSFPSFKASPTYPPISWIVLLSLLWVCLVLAVMRPQLVDKQHYVKNKGYDLMMAVDISGSMRALDFSTEQNIVSRLDATKEVVSKFVSERQGDRVGLVLFGEHAYLNVPLTLDTLSVSQMLNNSIAGMAGDATAIGDAIGLAIKTLRDRPEGSRVIILLSDGDDTASSIPPMEAAKLAKQYDVRIYTIGVGKDGLVPYPNGRGGVVMAQMSMNEGMLEDIARTTDGKYFQATNAKALGQIYEHINALEKSEAEAKDYLIRSPLYQYPLGVAAVLLFILCVMPLYRRVAYGA